MADLDDFFAKKDKKKPKAKKFATTEETVRQLEDTSKKITDSKTKKGLPSSESASEKAEPEDEWKAFEEQRKDYSGLKLAQLSISDQDSSNNAGDGNDNMHDENSENDGTGDNTDRDPTGPWKKVEDGEGPAQEETTEKTSSNLYVLPALKAKRKKGVAPDLKNEEYFPTLGVDSKQPSLLAADGKKGGAFEEVKNGGKVKIGELGQQTAPVAVGNRFTSLSDAS